MGTGRFSKKSPQVDEDEGLQISAEGEETVFHLRGSLDRSRVPSLWPALQAGLRGAGGKKIVLDLEEVSGVDSAGVAMLRLLDGSCDRSGRPCIHRNLPPQVGEFLGYAEERSSEKGAPPPPPPGPVLGTGLWTLGLLDSLKFFVEFFGLSLLAAARILIRPKELRLRETLYHLQRAGAEAVPFIAFLGGLMGFIMGIQATTTLADFGAAVKIADVVTLGTMKEMGPLLTAVIIAGRSGAAFAAEIGTMKIKEEIDALQVMGFEPMRFLVLPRVFALAAAGPLLTMIADGAGIVGGMITGILALDLAPLNYLTEVGLTITPTLVYEGLIKGLGFALLIGINGCFHGLRAGTAAEDVGIQTTSAIVSGIFLLVVADAFFSGLFHIYFYR